MPYSETGPITTKDVIDQINSKNLDGARDGIKDILYKKSAEAMADKKAEVAKGIGKPLDPHSDVIDAPTTVDAVDFETEEPTTSEE